MRGEISSINQSSTWSFGNPTEYEVVEKNGRPILLRDAQLALRLFQKINLIQTSVELAFDDDKNQFFSRSLTMLIVRTSNRTNYPSNPSDHLELYRKKYGVTHQQINAINKILESKLVVDGIGNEEFSVLDSTENIDQRVTLDMLFSFLLNNSSYKNRIFPE